MNSKQLAASKPIAIVGPGNSGGGCVAAVLKQLGIAIGTDFVPTKQTTSHHRWQDIEFVEANELFLNQQSIDKNDWQLRISSIVKSRRTLGIRWAWNDPRTSQLVPEFLQIVPDTVFIRTRRNFDEIIDSIYEAYGSQVANQAEQIVIERERALDTHLPSQGVLDVDFTNMLRNPASVIETIERFLDINPTASQRAAAIESLRAAHEPDTAKRHDASIVIPTFNEGNWLLRTVLSINHSSNHCNYEIVVVDDGSTDGSVEKLAGIENVKVIRSAGQTGVPAAKNLGAEHACGSFICFLDSHVIVAGKWLDNLIETCRTATSPSLVSTFIAPHDTLGDTNRRLTWQYGYTLQNWQMSTGWHYYGDQVFDTPFEVPLCPGGVMLLEREWFLELGGFPAEFGKWGSEDVEISLRNFVRGGDCLVDPRNLVYHFYKPSNIRPYLTREEKFFNVLMFATIYFESVKIQGLTWVERVCNAISSEIDVEQILTEVNICLEESSIPAWIKREAWVRSGNDWVGKFADQINCLNQDASSHPANRP